MWVFQKSMVPLESNVKMLPEWINRLLTKILLIENYFICHGWRFCFGLSVFIIAQKSNSEAHFDITEGCDSINLNSLDKG